LSKVLPLGSNHHCLHDTLNGGIVVWIIKNTKYGINYLVEHSCIDVSTRIQIIMISMVLVTKR